MPKARRTVAPERVSQELPPDFPPVLLQELHLLTRAGGLNADARRKLKQIQHLLTQIRPATDDVMARFPEPAVVDAGASMSAPAAR